MKAIIKKTNGKKTGAIGILMLLFQILMLYKPELINPTTERTITIVISSGVIPTLLHRVWRNRKKIGTYIKNKINGLKRQKNK
jgi:hypothetical protein